MKLYVHLENGEVDYGPGPLPGGWGLVSGLEALSENELLALGWLPVAEEYAELPPNHRHGEPTLALEADQGILHYPAEPIPVPEAVPALNGMLAIDSAGLSADFEAWANAPERTFAERAFLKHANTWRRDNPVLIAGAAAVGVGAEALDALFRVAAALNP